MRRTGPEPGNSPPGPFASGQAEGAAAEALRAAFHAKIPMRRMGEPDKIGKAVLVLASDMASYMTGSQAVVDGGALLS